VSEKLPQASPTSQGLLERSLPPAAGVLAAGVLAAGVLAAGVLAAGVLAAGVLAGVPLPLPPPQAANEPINNITKITLTANLSFFITKIILSFFPGFSFDLSNIQNKPLVDYIPLINIAHYTYTKLKGQYKKAYFARISF